MKFISTLLFALAISLGYSQSLQLHYDLRHSVDPQRNPKNFPTLYFEYFRGADTGENAFVKRGALLFKTQADFTGEQNNIGKYYVQVSQDVRFWRPKVFLSFQYSGGMGVTTPRQYSYYITNTWSAGVSFPFQLGTAYFSSVLFFKYVPYTRPTKDFLYTFYFYKGLFNYKAEFAGDFSMWTENKNHGDELTENLSGKRFSFFAEPQLWYNLNRTFAFGTKINMYYHVLSPDDVFNIYPAVAFRCKLNNH